MAENRFIRERGKTKLSEYFKELKNGDTVAIVRDMGFPGSFPKRIQGRTGVIEARRGNAYIVRLQEFNQEKRFIVQAIHLKKLNQDSVSSTSVKAVKKKIKKLKNDKKHGQEI